MRWPCPTRSPPAVFTTCASPSASRAELEPAAALLDERGVPHGAITDLGDAFGLYILAFRDPDNVQLELTAAYG